MEDILLNMKYIYSKITNLDLFSQKLKKELLINSTYYKYIKKKLLLSGKIGNIPEVLIKTTLIKQ